MQIPKLPRSIVPEKADIIDDRTAGNVGGAISFILAVFRRRGIPGVETGTWCHGNDDFKKPRAAFSKIIVSVTQSVWFTLGISR